MKTTVLVLAALMLTACGQVDRAMATYTGAPSETCYKGVVYLQFTSGATVKYTPEGKIATC